MTMDESSSIETDSTMSKSNDSNENDDHSQDPGYGHHLSTTIRSRLRRHHNDGHPQRRRRRLNSCSTRRVVTKSSSSSSSSSKIILLGLLLLLVSILLLDPQLDPQLRPFAVVVAASSSKEEEQEQECDASSINTDGSNSRKKPPPPPQVILNGQRLEINEQNFVKKYGSYNNVLHSNDEEKIDGHNTDNGNDNEYYILNHDKHVLYIPNFLDTKAIDGPNGLIQLCLDQNRFVRSPVRKNMNDEDGEGDDPTTTTTTTKHDDHRTSESCTGIPVAMYRKNPKVQAMIYPNGMTTGDTDTDELPEQLQKIKREMELHWDVATKATKFIHDSDKVDPSIIEPLQIVRYTHPNSQYKLHHDHGGFYRNSSRNKESSSTTETTHTPVVVVDERPWTMLVFLNTPLEGGHTSFPKLGLEVMPRKGDAIVWSNVVRRTKAGDDEVLATEVVDPDMVHAGLPPTKGEKYALNIWFGPPPPPPRGEGQGQDDDAGGGAEKLQQQGRWQ